MGIIAKQSIKGTIVTYIGVAIGFVTTFFVLTRFLTTEEIGLSRVLIDAATLFVGLAQLGTSSSIVRFFPYFRDEENHHGFFFWMMVVPFLGFAIFALIYWGCFTPLSAWFGEKSPMFVDYYYFVVPIAFCMLYQAVFETSASVMKRIVVPKFVREVLIRVCLLISYLLYAFHVLSLDGFVIALCGSYAVAAIVNAGYFFSLGQVSLRPDWAYLRAHRDTVRSYLFYTGFLILSALASVLAPTLSSFFITAKMGLQFTGIFAIATYIAVIVSIPFRSLAAITQPELAQAIKDADTFNCRRLLSQASNNMLLIGGFIFLTIWFNIDLIFHLLPNGQDFACAKHVVLLLGIGQLIVASLSIYVSALGYSRFYAFSLLNSLVLTGSAIVLNNYLIPLYGMNGAALATVISDVLYYIFAVTISSWALRLVPFHRQHGYTLMLLVGLFAINWAWTQWMPIDHIWLDCIVRSVVLIGGGLGLAYRLRLSKEIDALLRGFFVHRN